MLSCNTETQEPKNNQENPFLTESKFGSSPLFETDETLKNYTPAKLSEIELVRTTTDEYSIKYGYSFGECYGFCESKVEFTSNGVLNTRFRWSDEKETTEYIGIADSIYNELITSIDYKEFIEFDEYLGCGDCADGGNEWIEIKNGEQTRKLGGTYGFEIEYISSLLHFLRHL